MKNCVRRKGPWCESLPGQTHQTIHNVPVQTLLVINDLLQYQKKKSKEKKEKKRAFYLQFMFTELQFPVTACLVIFFFLLDKSFCHQKSLACVGD